MYLPANMTPARRHYSVVNVARQFTMSSSGNNTSTGTGTGTAAADPTTASSPLTTPTTSLDPTIDTSTDIPTTTAPAETTSAPPSPTTTEQPPTTTSNPPTTTEPTTTTVPTTTAPTTTSEPPTTTSTTSATSPTTTSPTTSLTSPTTTSPTTTSPTSEPSTSSTLTTTFQTTQSDGKTVILTVTSTQAVAPTSTTGTDPSSTSGGILQGDSSSSGGLNSQGKIAVAVVVPIAAVALLVVAGIFLWRKRKQRKDAEEERRKEVEDYIYNPNADPTMPDVGSSGGGAYEMKEDASSGYRGWGSTTLAGSTGRKASTTMSGGAAGVAYSDTPTMYGNVSDTKSGEPLMSDGSHSPEGEILGAMGPATSDNRGGNVHRGPSNASSSYSAAGRSDGSAENGIGVAYGGGGYYDQYGNNPYDNGQQAGGQPIIRDNPARRNTRIENPSHYPQQSAGISQNF
ncbi:hypothetical protein JX266_000020 [Neoarthrinium moseri]|nr:hypothetical protein JX266_000020 [Neoarthrinium moseri]